MNNARKTLNVYLHDELQTRLPTFTFYTGDEDNPTIRTPAVAVKWLDGHFQGKLPESRMRLVQIEVAVDKQDTSKAENACEHILEALQLRLGTQPKGTIPKKDYTAGRPGVALGTNLILTLQAENGWIRLDPPQQQTRLYVLTLEVDYVPDKTIL